MFSRPLSLAAALAFVLMPAWADDAASLKPTVTTVIDTTQTIIGQPITYPAGNAEVTASIITIPPGGETGWHLHAVPLFGYILEGALTVDYGDKGTHTYSTGEGLLEAIKLAAQRHEQGHGAGSPARRLCRRQRRSRRRGGRPLKARAA
jgi:quercetin dioxygenase-like cupin family protein